MARARLAASWWLIGMCRTAREAARLADLVALGTQGRDALLNSPAGQYSLREVLQAMEAMCGQYSWFRRAHMGDAEEQALAVSLLGLRLRLRVNLHVSWCVWALVL